MSQDPGLARGHLPVPAGRGPERTPLSLEMDRDGVRLRLASAVFDDLLGLEDLVLRVPHVGRAFDCTSGPRALQPAITRLDGVTVHVPLDRVIARVRPLAEPILALSRLRASGNRLVLSGVVGAVPFTVEIRVEPSARPGAIRLRLVDPRLWVPSDRSWRLLASGVAAAVPDAIRVASGEDWIDVAILRPVLTGLAANLGYKVPLMADAALQAVRVEPDRVSLRFGPGPMPGDAAVPPVGRLPENAESEAREVLEAMAGGARDPALVERFLRAGVAVPRMGPEVLARARTLGEDRPEAVLPHLAGALVLARDVRLAPESDTVRIARRLVAAVEAGGDALEMALAGRLLARIAAALSPAAALAVLDEVRSRGVEDASVLVGVALALDRLGRREEARAARSRALALVPVGATADTLREMVARLEAAGLDEVAAGWLEETIGQCDQGTFGSEGGAIRRQAVVLLATRDSLSPDRAEEARRRLRELLQADPCDREALDLLLALASCGREAAEAVARFKAAADVASGEARAGYLMDAAGATLERLGLRRQAVDLLEAAREAAPRNEAITAALDRLYQDLGLADRRLALIRHRLAWTEDPVRRGVLRFDGAVLAEALGLPETVLELLRPLLDEDPTHVPALRLAVSAARAAGDASLAERAAASLADLAPEAEPPRPPARPDPVRAPVATRPPGVPAPAASGPRLVDGPPDEVSGEADAEIDRYEAEARWLKARVDGAAAALDAGDAATALDAALDALRVDPVHVGALRLAVAAATAAGQLDQALELGRRWIDRLFSPAEQVAALIELADLQRLRSDDPAGPAGLLARAAAVAPEDPRVLAAALDLARIRPGHAEAVLLPVATAAASGALAHDPAGVSRCAARLYEAAGVAWDELGAIPAATAMLEVVVGLDPDHEAARADLGILYHASGRAEAARALLEDDG